MGTKGLDLYALTGNINLDGIKLGNKTDAPNPKQLR